MKDLINPLLDIRYINFVMYNSHNGQTHFEIVQQMLQDL